MKTPCASHLCATKVRMKAERLKGVPCYTKDEGRPLEAGLQWQASNHPKLLW